MIDSASSIDLIEMTVETAQAGFASGAFTAETLTQAYLDRIAEWNPHYNAIIFMNPAALVTAREIDRRRAAGEALAPLAGAGSGEGYNGYGGLPQHRRLVPPL
jgi:aspartyl-tRNA(Asn)/glutamyl-tRNA(Gln) amidotransferase subunit A